MNKDTNKIKCKDTKKLVRIATEHGMTGKEIALKAGLKGGSTAQVSRWRNGESLATERQMRFFINEFGEQLRRKSEHLLTVEQDNGLAFIKLTGDLIVKHVIRGPIFTNKKANIAICRFLIFRQHNQFYFVYQNRKGFDTEGYINNDILKVISHCDNEDANWVSKDKPSLLSLEQLLQSVDKAASMLKDGSLIKQYSSDFSGQELQFCIRRYLMREGFSLPDIIDISNQS